MTTLTYQDLCKQQQQYNNVLIERRATLREQIRQLRVALAMDLGLLERTYKKQLNDPAPTEPYVKITDCNGAPSDAHQLKAEYHIWINVNTGRRSNNLPQKTGSTCYHSLLSFRKFRKIRLS